MNAVQSRSLYSDRSSLFLWLSLGASIFLFAMFNRVSLDDMFFFSRVRDQGISSMVSEQYNQYSGRFAAYTLNGLILSLPAWLLPFWNMFSLVSFFVMLKKLLSQFNFLSWKQHGMVLFFLAVFFGVTHPGEEFFWYTQVNTYLWSATCGIFILYFLLLAKPRSLHWILVIPATFFMGASSESMLIQFLLLFVLVLYFQPSNRRIVLLKRSLPVFVVCGFSAYFSFSAPGNGLRMDAIQQSQPMDFLPALARSFAHYYVSDASLVRFLCLLPFLAITAFHIDWKQKISFWRISAIYALLMLLCLVPTAWTLREAAPPRALIYPDVLTALYFLFVCRSVIDRFSLTPFPFTITTALVSVIIALHAYQGFTYSLAFDLREKMLQSNKRIQDLNAVMVPMPYTRVQKMAEIDPRIDHYSRTHFMLYYRLK